MSDRNFSRRRRGGMRFRPSGGFNQNQQKARPLRHGSARRSHGRKKADGVFEKRGTTRKSNARKTSPPACPPRARRPGTGPGSPARCARAKKGAPFASPTWRPRPRCGGEIRAGADQATSRPTIKTVKKGDQKGSAAQTGGKKDHKEIIINAESLETRIAVQEDGRWRNSPSSAPPRSAWSAASSRAKSATSKTASRPRLWTSALRKIPSCIIGTLCRTSFDSGVEVVEREGNKRRDRPASRRRTSRACIRPAAKSSCRSPKAPSAPRARA
jgi:hypothetical protein